MKVKCVQTCIFPMGAVIHKNRVLTAKLDGDWFKLNSGHQVHKDVFWDKFRYEGGFNLPATIDDLESWHPTIKPVSWSRTFIALVLTFLITGFTIGYIFNALNSFNAWIGG